MTIPPSRTLLNYFLEDTNARRAAQTDIRVIKGLAHTSDILGRLAEPAGQNWQFLKRASGRLTKVCETIRASLDTAFEKEFKAALNDAGLEDPDEKSDFGGESASFCQGGKDNKDLLLAVLATVENEAAAAQRICDEETRIPKRRRTSAGGEEPLAVAPDISTDALEELFAGGNTDADGLEGFHKDLMDA